MEKNAVKALEISQKLNFKNKYLDHVSYKSNIEAGDILIRIILLGTRVIYREKYQAQKVGPRFIQVQFVDNGQVHSGSISFDDLLGGIFPAPGSQIMVHYQLIKKDN